MTGMLTSQSWLNNFGEQLTLASVSAGLNLNPILLPSNPDERLTDKVCEEIEIAVFSLDMSSRHGRSLFSSCYRAPNLTWVHLPGAGVDHSAYGRLLQRGIRLTTSAGSTAEPIAQSAIAGLLMLARHFPHHMDAQRRHAWEPLENIDAATDLRGQTLVVFGLGSIGTAIARTAQALGLHVVGVRRSPARPDDPVDELHTPDTLDVLLPRADWLAITSPLTTQTQGLFDTRRLALLPRGAHLINVGRGPIVDENALIGALQSGHIAGAYLDVFEEEPLSTESPLWDLPRVIITPHNSGAARGNEHRAAEIFIENLGHWKRNEPLRNEVFEAGI